MPLSLSPTERSQRARIAALSRWSQEDPKVGTATARAKFRLRFVDEVDPNRELPEVERERRAEAAFRAYMTKLAYQSARARRRKAAS